MLAGLDVVRRPGAFVYLTSLPDTPAPDEAVAVIDEGTAMTYIVPADSPLAAHAHFPAAWLTLTVESSLDSVGLTAIVAAALADAQIPANVLAGFHHDHLLVPVEMADDAIDVLRRLRSRS
jgi:hypothetical protein